MGVIAIRYHTSRSAILALLALSFFVGSCKYFETEAPVRITPRLSTQRQVSAPPTPSTTLPPQTSTTTTTTTFPPRTTTTTTTTTTFPPGGGGGSGPEEAFCPTGTNPDPNILWCSGFENLSACITGRESACWRNNQHGTVASGSWKVLLDSKAAVGNGSVQATPNPGGTGGGFYGGSIPGGPVSQANLRFYIKFSGTHMSYPSNHGPALIGDGNGCSFTSAFEISQVSHHIYINNTCAPTPPVNNLHANTGFQPVLENNRWYLIEMHVQAETSCTDINLWNGCNGQFMLWIDGQKVYDYPNYNWGQGTKNPQWNSFYGVRDYYARVPIFPYTLYYDNFVISNGSTIGPALNENPRGAGDPYSPHVVYNGMEPFQGGHPASDCTRGNNAFGVLYADTMPWRNNRGTFNSIMDRNGYQNTCANPQYTYNPSALQLDQPGGYFWARRRTNLGPSKFSPQEVIHGWIYLPSTNNYSNLEALSGVASHGNNYADYIAMSVHNGNWAIVKRQGGATPQIALQSTTTVTFDQWQEFEIIVWMNGHVSLMVGGQRIFNRESLSMPQPSWNNQSSPASLDLVLGIIDGPPLTIYYDDVNIGGASFWSCDGWNPNDPALCPF